jgi:hypothetical protein
MVAAINAPATGNNTLAAFTLLAQKASNSTSPPNTVPLGGVLALKGTLQTVTTSVTTTVTTTEVKGQSTFATTYATTYGTTYTTDVVQQLSTSAPGSAPSKTSSAGSGSSTTAKPNAATVLSANGAMVGAVVLGALAML